MLGTISRGKAAGVGRWFCGQKTRGRRACMHENNLKVPNVLGSKAVFKAGYGHLGPFVLVHWKVHSTTAVSLKGSRERGRPAIG